MKFLSALSVCILVVLSTLIAGCGQQLTKNDPSNPNPVNLERDFQEVIHHDCNGNVTKDGIETVASPTAWVQINPANTSRTYNPSFTDEQTGSSPTWMVGDFSFQVDYSFGVLNMHVVSGINTIDYSFSYCTAWSTDVNGNSVCTAQTVDEKGTVTINVNYTEKTLSGSMSVSDCNPSPSPTPAPH